MRELQILVDPCLRCRGEVWRELAGGKHHLVIAILQVIPVDTDVIELIVQTDRLGLLVHLQQRPRVPQPDILDRVLVPCQHGGREVGQGRIGGLLDSLQVIGLSREVDVVLQIRRLERQLAWLHDEFLDDGRQQEDADDIDGEVDAGSHNQRPQARAEDIQCQQRTGHRRDGDHDPQRDPCHMIGGKSGAIDDAQSRVDEFIVIQAEPEGPVGNQDEEQNRYM